MKILFTTEHYYPALNGVSLVVKNIAENLAKKGHHITVATTKLPERQFDNLNGVKVIEFQITGNSVKGIKEGKKGEIERYKELLINGNYDLIAQYAAQTWHSDLTYNVLDYIKAKKVLFPCGYSGLVLWTKRIFYWNYFKKLPFYLKKYDHVIYHVGNYIDKRFGDKHGIKTYSIIPNGIDAHEMQIHSINFKQYYNIKTKYMLLNVSNHFKLKGHAFLLKAFSRLKRDDVTLVIIGNKVPGLRGCYRKCTQKALNNPKVIFLESIPRDHVVSAFHEADIFVFGSKVEYFPLVILESMAVGCPFVSTNVGCVPGLKGGVTVSDINSMVANINKLLHDSGIRKELGNLGRNECLTKYTWDKIVPKYEELFQRLLNE